MGTVGAAWDNPTAILKALGLFKVISLANAVTDEGIKQYIPAMVENSGKLITFTASSVFCIFKKLAHR